MYVNVDIFRSDRFGAAPPPPSQDNIRGAGKAGDVIVGRQHQPRRQLVEFDGNMIRGTTLGPLGGDPTNLME